MGKPSFRTHIKQKHVALNPVTRAVAWVNLRKYADDAKLKMYFMDEGQDCEEWAMPLARFLTMVLVAVEYDRRVEDPELRPDYLDVQIAQQAITLISQNEWKFERSRFAEFERGIDAAQRLTKAVTPYAVNHAWKVTH